MTDNQSGVSLNEMAESELSPDEDVEVLRNRGMTEQEATAKMKERLQKRVAHEKRK